MGGFINPYNPALSAYLHQAHLAMTKPLTVAILSSEIMKQSQMLTFVNVFAFITWSFLIMLPLVLLFKYKRKKRDEMMPIQE